MTLERNKYGAIRRKSIPLSVRRRLWMLPCVICGVPFDIHIDHIVPVAAGGGPEESNLQPLCRDCNYTKKHLRSTDEVRIIVWSRGIGHFLKAMERWENRFAQFACSKPLTKTGRIEAMRLHDAFLESLRPRGF